ncbi:MAG: hypothetical protein DMG58_16435 [Acidobacteria bacterium]|nr:MAG: hypothetical protein DMG58_16435 [Acidobacteriota bacterium]
MFWLRNNDARQSAKFLPGGEMDVPKILTELRQEREQIEEAIMSLERLARGRGRRRGRPPAWMSELDKKRGRPPGSKNKNTNLQKAVGLA